MPKGSLFLRTLERAVVRGSWGRRRQVALGVAAAVSWAAKTNQVASPAATDALSCLFRADNPDSSGLLVVAERCIGAHQGSKV